MLSYDLATGGFDYDNPEGAKVIARQQLGQLYLRNGVAYAINRLCLLEQRSIKGKNSGALVLEENFIRHRYAMGSRPGRICDGQG